MTPDDVAARDRQGRLHIGVTGHREPPKLPLAAIAPLRSSVSRLLLAIAAAEKERDEAGRPVVVSSLADGTDRIVAEAGLASGFGLFAILPHRPEDYAKDFVTPGSRAAFEELLLRAEFSATVAPAASDRTHAYQAAGLAMVSNSDIIVTIWDGNPKTGIGGTEEIIARAIADGRPVLWINPAAPDSLMLASPRTTASTAHGPTRDSFRPASLDAAVKAIRLRSA